MPQKIAIIDDDLDVRHSLCALLGTAGYQSDSYGSAREFLENFDTECACVISDVRMAEMDGFELQRTLQHRGLGVPVIMITGYGDVSLAVRAIQEGVLDFIEKPFTNKILLDSLKRALDAHEDSSGQLDKVQDAKYVLSLLTPREFVVLRCLVNAASTKIAAHELGISPRTIENHRASIMGKLHARNLADAVRATLMASQDGLRPVPRLTVQDPSRRREGVHIRSPAAVSSR
jgi:two-component system response regulator FixJ